MKYAKFCKICEILYGISLQIRNLDWTFLFQEIWNGLDGGV